MSKTSIGWLYSLTLIFEIILIITFFNVSADTVTIRDDQAIIQQLQQQIQQDQGNPSSLAIDQQQLAEDQQSLAQDQQAKLPGIITTLILMVIVGFLGMIAWIGALINLSRGQEWTWFLLVLFFGGIMLLIYVIGGPTVPETGQTPVPHQPSALDILQQRFARGEIDAATYQQMRDQLLEPFYK